MKKVIKYIFIALAVFVGLAILILIINPAGNSKKDDAQTQQSSQPQEQAIVVTATKLLQDYEANEVAADAQYKKKIVEVSGTISTIGKDILDTPYISLAAVSFLFSACLRKATKRSLPLFQKTQRLLFADALAENLGTYLFGNVRSFAEELSAKREPKMSVQNIFPTEF